MAKKNEQIFVGVGEEVIELTGVEKDAFIAQREADNAAALLLEAEYEAKKQKRIDAINKLATVAGLTEEEINAILNIQFALIACAELRRLGINKKLHSGRHYFATNAYSVSNGDILAVSKLMRHASPATTAIYAELASPVAKQVVNAMQTPGIE